MQLLIHKRHMLWMISAFVFVSTLTNLAEATVVCEGCRPMSLQEGPGVGISLSPGVGAAAVHFVNGTTLDIGTIEASEAYVQAIKIWPRTGPSWVMEPDPANDSLLRRLLLRLRLLKLAIPQRRTAEPLFPLRDMVQALWQKVNASVHLEHTRVFVSVPDFVAEGGGSLSAHAIGSLLESAGLQELRWMPLCRASLIALYNIEDCYDEDDERYCRNFHGRPIDSVLSIHLDTRSMSLRSVIRDDGSFFPDLGAAELVWRDADTKLEDNIRHFINANASFDLVSLSGPEATQLYDTIKELFKDNAHVVPEEFMRSVEDHTFAPARGAARLARRGMCNDFTACIPRWSWCPISDHCRDYFYLPLLGEKEEL